MKDESIDDELNPHEVTQAPSKYHSIHRLMRFNRKLHLSHKRNFKKLIKYSHF